MLSDQRKALLKDLFDSYVSSGKLEKVKEIKLTLTPEECNYLGELEREWQLDLDRNNGCADEGCALIAIPLVLIFPTIYWGYTYWDEIFNEPSKAPWWGWLLMGALMGIVVVFFVIAFLSPSVERK